MFCFVLRWYSLYLSPSKAVKLLPGILIVVCCTLKTRKKYFRTMIFFVNWCFSLKSIFYSILRNFSVSFKRFIFVLDSIFFFRKQTNETNWSILTMVFTVINKCMIKCHMTVKRILFVYIKYLSYLFFFSRYFSFKSLNSSSYLKQYLPNVIDLWDIIIAFVVIFVFFSVPFLI